MDRRGTRAKFTRINPDTKFLDDEDVEGVHLVHDFDLVREMQVRLGKFAKGQTIFFPVMWPVSLSMKNVQSLISEPYVVGPKPSGPRFLLYIDSSGNIFLENMTQHIFRVDEDHAIKMQMLDGQPIIDTVLDGIITREKLNGADARCEGNKEGPAGKLTFVIRDAVRCIGKDLTGLNILERITLVKEEIIIPRTYVQGKENEAFDLDIVEYEEAHRTENFFSDEYAQRFKYPLDFFIFYPKKKGKGYRCGSNPNFFKWQENDNQKCSFRLKIPKGIENPTEAELHIGGPNSIIEIKYDTIRLTEEIKKLEGCIIDCRYIDQQWVFIKQRHDRNHPNGNKAVMEKMEALENQVSRDFLLAHLDNARGME